MCNFQIQSARSHLQTFRAHQNFHGQLAPAKQRVRIGLRRSQSKGCARANSLCIVAARCNRNTSLHRVVYLARTICFASLLVWFSHLAGGKFPAAWRQSQNARNARGQPVARHQASCHRLRNFCHRSAFDGNCAQARFATSSELPFVWSHVGVLRVLPAAANCAEFSSDESPRFINQPSLARKHRSRNHFCGVALAQSSARSPDIHRRHSDGVDVRARAKYPASCRRPSASRFARVVGIPDRLAPHAPCRPRLLFAVFVLTERWEKRNVGRNPAPLKSTRVRHPQVQNGSKAGAPGKETVSKSP